MGNTESNVTSGVKKQADTSSIFIYKLVDLNGGGLLVELMKQAAQTKKFSELDNAIKTKVEPFLYNKGEGRMVPIWKMVLLRNKDRPRYKLLQPLKNMDDPNDFDIDLNIPTPPEVSEKMDYREVCWSVKERGAVGETILHLCLLNATSIHADLAKRLLKFYPKLINDIYISDEYYGENVLHWAIVNEDPSMVKFLLDSGANYQEKCIGNFMCCEDQKASRTDSLDHEWVNLQLETNYEGYVYWGEYPLSIAACLDQEECYRLMLARGANPNSQDTNGNTVLHMLVIYQKMAAFDMAYEAGANLEIKNYKNLTPLTLAAKLARTDMFFHILNIEREVYWQIGNVTCAAYPLSQIDTIDETSGYINSNSALNRVVFGDKDEHLELMDGVLVDLLNEKWNTFVKFRFYRQFLQFLLYFLLSVICFTMRPGSLPIVENLTTNQTINNQNGISSNGTEKLNSTLNFNDSKFLTRFERNIINIIEINNYSILENLSSPTVVTDVYQNFTLGNFVLENQNANSIHAGWNSSYNTNNNQNYFDNNSAAQQETLITTEYENKSTPETFFHTNSTENDLEDPKFKIYDFKSSIQPATKAPTFLENVTEGKWNLTLIEEQISKTTEVGNQKIGSKFHFEDQNFSKIWDNATQKFTENSKNITINFEEKYTINASKTSSSDKKDGHWWRSIKKCRLLVISSYMDIIRFILEIILEGAALLYLLAAVQEAGFLGINMFIENLMTAPSRVMFLFSCLLMMSLPILRFTCLDQAEDIIAVCIMLTTSPYFLFYCRGFKTVGPFVVMIYRMVTGDLLRFVMIYLVFVMGFSQAYYVIFLSFDNPNTPDGVDDSITNPMPNPVESIMAMFLMSLNMFNDYYAAFEKTNHGYVAKLCFVIYMVIVAILLVNMLIAMMGNTYQKIAETRNEWQRQWARIVLVVERGVKPAERLKQLMLYSQPMSDGKRALVLRLKQSDEDKEEMKEILEMKRMHYRNSEKQKIRNQNGALACNKF